MSVWIPEEDYDLCAFEAAVDSADRAVGRCCRRVHRIPTALNLWVGEAPYLWGHAKHRGPYGRGEAQAIDL